MQVDQGLGIGSKFPIFNRHQITSTHFLQLKKVVEDEKAALPPVLVLHGRYGGCIGDLAAYDAFTLGGPYSVRGYNMGELGACRNFLEVMSMFSLPNLSLNMLQINYVTMLQNLSDQHLNYEDRSKLNADVVSS